MTTQNADSVPTTGDSITDFPNEGGWWCEACGRYFSTELSACPCGGSTLDEHQGYAVKAAQIDSSGA